MQIVTHARKSKEPSSALRHHKHPIEHAKCSIAAQAQSHVTGKCACTHFDLKDSLVKKLHEVPDDPEHLARVCGVIGLPKVLCHLLHLCIHLLLILLQQSISVTTSPQISCDKQCWRFVQIRAGHSNSESHICGFLKQRLLAQQYNSCAKLVDGL